MPASPATSAAPPQALVIPAPHSRVLRADATPLRFLLLPSDLIAATIALGNPPSPSDEYGRIRLLPLLRPSPTGPWRASRECSESAYPVVYHNDSLSAGFASQPLAPVPRAPDATFSLFTTAPAPPPPNARVFNPPLVQPTFCQRILQDPVEAPVLTSFPNNSNSDLCNITVSCRSDDLSNKFMCYNKTCQEKTEAQSGYTVLSVFINESSIICNHSNPASWKMDVLEMRRFCGDKGQDNGQEPDLLPTWVVVLISLIVIIIITIFYFCRRRTPTGDPQCENTLYAEVQPNGENIPLEHPSTVYSVVGAKAQTSGTEERSQTTPSPEKQVKFYSDKKKC
ncbi:uncharacterized protein [Hoplias malabaricus]|uniref:uncharacterized protein n=1 Tax=Hoplias malabaricus TaxID=27720 RepID=UPI0034624558